MRPSRPPSFARLALLLAIPLVPGCATSYIPSPDEIPRLEERVRERPEDVESLTRLGAAYSEGERLQEAADLLEQARTVDPEDANAAFFLGLVYEQLERPTEAVVAFEDYLTLAPDTRFRGQALGRIRVLRRAELRAAVRQTLQRESELSAAPAPGTVAVFPFVFAGQDEDLRPLARALSEMLVTDLSVTDRLTVLERVRIQALLDEVALGESGYTDEATAARGGRLLGAGRVVQGQLAGGTDDLRIDAAVVRVEASPDVATVSQQDALERVFDMEKALALDIYDRMGVALTAAERERVNERGTENLQALLAFGRGLEASDRGQYAEAQQHFAEAARLDPGFSEANDLATETAEVVEAESVTVAEVTASVAESVVEVQVETQVTAVTDQAQNAGTRDAAQEALGTEGVSKAVPTMISIIFRRPGGGQ